MAISISEILQSIKQVNNGKKHAALANAREEEDLDNIIELTEVISEALPKLNRDSRNINKEDVFKFENQDLILKIKTPMLSPKTTQEASNYIKVLKERASSVEQSGSKHFPKPKTLEEITYDIMNTHLEVWARENIKPVTEKMLSDWCKKNTQTITTPIAKEWLENNLTGIIKPYLQEWLNSNLTPLVKVIVEKEIQKLIPQNDETLR